MVYSENMNSVYDPVNSKASQEAIQILNRRLCLHNSHEEAEATSNTNINKFEKNSPRKPSTIELKSLRSTYSYPLLNQFYQELMMKNFPFEEERDDIDDWITCLDPNADPETVDLNGPLMDVMLVIKNNANHYDEDMIEEDKIDHEHEMIDIIAGVVFEYYQKAEVGLVSYICVSEGFKRKGIMKLLHPLAINAIQSLQNIHTNNTSSTNEKKPSIRAIFAETNTINAGDAPVDVIKTRHQILYSLGYRLLYFPYSQPPLETHLSSFDDVMLLVYQGKGSIDEDNNNEVIDSSEHHTSQCGQLSSQIAYDYVVDFYMSVYGYHESSIESFQGHWYYKLVSWYVKHYPMTAIMSDPPNDGWVDMIDTFQSLYDEDTTKMTDPESEEQFTVLIIGGGVAGLSTAVHLSESYSKMPQGKYHSLRILLAEANSFVGGRVRTILTDSHQAHLLDNGENRIHSCLQKHALPSKDLIEHYKDFSPWPIPLGAEFVHGSSNSCIHDMVIKNGWNLEETFNFESRDEDSPTKFVKIFGDGRCWDLNFSKDSLHSASSNNDQNYRQLIQTAQCIWDKICDVSEAVYSGKEPYIPQDCSVADFVHQYLIDEEVEPEAIEKIKNIIDSMYARTAGTSATHYGVNEASREEQMWDYDERNFRTKGCFSELILHLLDRLDDVNKRHKDDRKVHVEIITDCAVKTLDSFRDENDTLKVRCSTTGNLKEFECDKVVVAVPLAVLKKQRIKFQGEFELPPAKALAVSSINMFSGMKAHILLKKLVDIRKCEILENTDLFFCPGEIFSQVWLRRDESSVFMTGFVVAQDKDRLEHITEQEINKCHHEKKENIIKELFLDQVSRMINDDDIFLNKNMPSCSAFSFYDWSDDEYTLGLYSSPTVGAGWYVDSNNINQSLNYDNHSDHPQSDRIIKTYRNDLSTPLNDTIFFAGECVNIKTCATVQSAFESGVSAADNVVKSLEIMIPNGTTQN